MMMTMVMLMSVMQFSDNYDVGVNNVHNDNTKHNNDNT